jgi:hypothetical protein
MYSLSNSIDFYWLIFRGCPEQRSPHPVQHAEFEAIASHHSIADQRIATAASDAKYIGSWCFLLACVSAGVTLDAYSALAIHPDPLAKIGCGVLAVLLLAIGARMKRAGWRLRHRQLGGWWELMLPAALAFRMRDPDGRGPNEVEA